MFTPFLISGVMWVFYMTRQWWIRRTSVKAGICWWIRNMQVICICMTLSEIPLWLPWKPWDIPWIPTIKTRFRRLMNGWFSREIPWNQSMPAMMSLTTWFPATKHWRLFIPVMVPILCRKMRIWAFWCRKRERTSGMMPWLWPGIVRIQNWLTNLWILCWEMT